MRRVLIAASVMLGTVYRDGVRFPTHVLTYLNYHTQLRTTPPAGPARITFIGE